jgi:hypothetical protein
MFSSKKRKRKEKSREEINCDVTKGKKEKKEGNIGKHKKQSAC